MADNVNITEGTGKTVATTENSQGEQIQHVLISTMNGTTETEVGPASPFPVSDTIVGSKLDILHSDNTIGHNDNVSILAGLDTLNKKGFDTTAFETLSVTSSTAVALTSGTYGAATKAIIIVENADIRFRTDGSNPTTSVGMLVKADSTNPAQIELDSAADIAAFRTIAVSTTATISVSYMVAV